MNRLTAIIIALVAIVIGAYLFLGTGPSAPPASEGITPSEAPSPDAPGTDAPAAATENAPDTGTSTQ